MKVDVYIYIFYETHFYLRKTWSYGFNKFESIIENVLESISIPSFQFWGHFSRLNVVINYK